MKKTAFITGASGSVGSLLVEKLKGLDIECYTTDRKGNNTFNCDITDIAQISLYINQLPIKKLDYLFNVAGVGIYKRMETLSIKEYLKSVDVNMVAPFVVSKLLINRLKKSSDPRIINVGSIMGTTPTKDRTAYCSSKYGLRGLSLTMSEEFEDRIKVSLLTLGSVMNNFGTGGIRKRVELKNGGKKYLTNESVVEKLISIMLSKKPKKEYVFLP